MTEPAKVRTASAVRRRNLIPILLLALLLPAAAQAGELALGTKIALSDCAGCTQSQPRVAGLPNGRFVTVWEGSSAADSRAVLGRLFEAAGSPRGAAAILNRVIAPEQVDAAVAADSRGYVAVWSETVSGGDSDIVAQRFRPLGSRLGTEIAVNVDPAGPIAARDFSPAVVKTADGGFVVVWIRYTPPGADASGTDPQVMARGFNAAGAPLGAPVKVSTGLASGDRPDACVDTAGRIVAVWTTVDAFRPFQPSLEGVAARRFSPAGVAAGAEVAVARPLAAKSPAAVSCGPGNTFVAIWQSDQAPAAQRSDIVAQRFTRLNRRQGATFVVNGAAGVQEAPAVATDAAGGFVVVWHDQETHAVNGRRFGANTLPLGAAFEVQRNPPPDDPSEADVATVPGGFVVVWRQGRQSLAGRRFAVTSTPSAVD